MENTPVKWELEARQFYHELKYNAKGGVCRTSLATLDVKRERERDERNLLGDKR